MGYVFGLFQTGFIYGRSKGIDIRQHGSGNSGSTNALRVMGVKAGLIVFMGDFLKTVIPCFLVRILFRSQPGYIYVLILCAGFGVILGHNFPFYLKFKGGKGIAATAGIMFSLDWRLTAGCLLVFVLIVAVTRYVSLGSLVVLEHLFRPFGGLRARTRGQTPVLRCFRGDSGHGFLEAQGEYRQTGTGQGEQGRR